MLFINISTLSLQENSASALRLKIISIIHGFVDGSHNIINQII